MFTGKENHRITLEQAQQMLAAHRKSPGAAADGPWCEFFGREAIEKLLAQDGCVGIRIYHGRNDKGQRALVLVGATTDGSNLDSGDILEVGLPCPPVCPDGSLLHQ